MWFGVFRLGVWPELYPDVAFSREPAALEQFFRQGVPNTAPYDVEVNTNAGFCALREDRPGHPRHPFAKRHPRMADGAREQTRHGPRAAVGSAGARRLTDRVLFGEVWARPQLSQRDRSLVTISALIAMNRPDQFRSHRARARANGVTQEEAVEVITHLAFCTGWPNAVTAVGVAREVFANEKTQPPQ